MEFSQIGDIVGISNVSMQGENCLTAVYSGYNIKCDRIASLSVMDIEFYCSVKEVRAIDFKEFTTYLENTYEEISVTLKNYNLGILIGDLRKQTAEQLGHLMNDVVIFLNQHAAEPIKVPEAPRGSENEFSKSAKSIKIPSANNDSINQYTSSSKNTVAGADEHVNYFLGTVGAILGTCIGMIVWILIAQLGYISVLGGLAISAGALLGYMFFAKDISKAGLIISGVVFLIGVAAACWLSTVIIIMRSADIDFVSTVQNWPVFMSIKEVRISFIKDLVIGYIFAIAGAISLYFKIH